jgi:hypothetical protein
VEYPIRETAREYEQAGWLSKAEHFQQLASFGRIISLLSGELQHSFTGGVVAKTWTKAEWTAAREKLGLDNPFRRIPIRSRVDYENAMLIVDELRRSTAARVASEQLQPFEKMRIDRKLDDAERIFKGKLLSMRLRMLDADYDRQHTIEVRNTDEGLERKSAGTWKRTSEREVAVLAAQDGKEIHVKRGTFQANTEER